MPVESYSVNTSEYHLLLPSSPPGLFLYLYQLTDSDETLSIYLMIKWLVRRIEKKLQS